MVMELDTTKLSQAGSRKLTPHDNCTVLDLGTGSFPRLIELRLPGFDGARQSALWDGSLDLEVNDLVIADEYAGQSIWRISSMGGGDSGAGKVRVSKVWANDFTSVSLQTDASDNVTINTGTLTLPSDVIHLGDTDTKISFTDDKISFDAGGLNLMALTETTQNLVEIGDVAGGGDVDISLNNGGFFLRGSDTHAALGLDASVQAASTLNIREDQNSATRVEIRNATAGAAAQAQIRIANDPNHAFQCGITSTTFTTAGELTADDAFFQSLGGIDLVIRAVGAGNIKLGTNATVRQYIASDGKIGLNGVTSPSTELDIGAGAIEFDEMTAPAAGAVNTARLFSRDDGNGDTEFCIRFNSGLIQVIAPLEFGGISAIENTTATTISTAGVAVQILVFDTNEPNNGAIPDHTNDHVTVNKAGTYLITCTVTLVSISGAGAKFHLDIQKNNGATVVGQIHTDRNLAGGGSDAGSATMTGLAVLSSGDTIEAWVINETNTQNVIIEDINLAITMVGVNA